MKRKRSRRGAVERGRKGKRRQEPQKFKRCAELVVYWQSGRLVFDNYVKRSQFTAEPFTCSILHFCGEWRSFEEICAFLSDFSESSVQKSLEQLCENGVLERSDAKPDPTQEAIDSWASWNPAAGFFHFSTRDTKFTPDPMGALQELAEKAKHDPMPLPVKAYPRAPRRKLPRTRATGEFVETLRGRRTWRLYGEDAVPLEALAVLLELTFGIQGWAKVPGLGRAAMKTSPSCGCLHPMEAYVVVQRVKGLRRGIYHYNAAQHELERLRGGVSEKELEKNLGHQWWFAKGAFLVLMAAVFGRTRWKYESPRVYRGILLEAGHLCQTFCLTATWLGLAPFSTIAYADTQWERWLGIDGVTESVMYVAGAGTRPDKMRDAHLETIGKNGTLERRQRTS